MALQALIFALACSWPDRIANQQIAMPWIEAKLYQIAGIK
jgi:hypothetical protein